MPRIIMFPQDSAKRSEGYRGAQKAVARTFGVVITVLALWLICSSSAQAWGISLDTLSALMEQDTLNRMMAEQERLRNIRQNRANLEGTQKMKGVYFVSGIDTDIGKTVATSVLAKQLLQ